MDEDGRNITVGSSFILKGARFEQSGTMTVVGNVMYDMRGDDQGASLTTTV